MNRKWNTLSEQGHSVSAIVRKPFQEETQTMNSVLLKFSNIASILSETAIQHTVHAVREIYSNYRFGD